MGGKFFTTAEILNRLERRVDDSNSSLAISLGGVFESFNTTQNLLTAPLSYNISLANDFVIKSISIVSDVPINETITISVINTDLYTTVPILIQELKNNKTFVAVSIMDYKIYSTEELLIECTNVGLVGNLTLIVNVESVG